MTAVVHGHVARCPSISEYSHDKGDGGANVDDVHIYMTNKDGMVSVRANFKAMRIYNECDRFAFAIQLEVDGKLKPIELELLIKRNDPKN